jgi:hypothetical protein
MRGYSTREPAAAEYSHPGHLARRRSWLEVDTVALSGEALDDAHLWMRDGVDLGTDWTEHRALENRSQHCTLLQIVDMETSLPFALRGIDSDNRGEFLNHLITYFQVRPQPLW